MWENDLVMMVRSILGDLDDSNYTYTTERIKQIIVLAAFEVINVASFINDYNVSIIDKTISPDPITTEDKDFTLLVAYKAACSILTYEMKNNCIYSIKDGPSSVTVNSTSSLKEGKKSVCDMYDKLIQSYLLYGGDNQDGIGQAVLGPYSPGSDLIYGED